MLATVGREANLFASSGATRAESTPNSLLKKASGDMEIIYRIHFVVPYYSKMFQAFQNFTGIFLYDSSSCCVLQLHVCDRYDGIYKVCRYWMDTGKSGFQVWRYEMRRDDPIPAPWTKQGKLRIQQLGLVMQVRATIRKRNILTTL